GRRASRPRAAYASNAGAPSPATAWLRRRGTAGAWPIPRLAGRPGFPHRSRRRSWRGRGSAAAGAAAAAQAPIRAGPGSAPTSPSPPPSRSQASPPLPIRRTRRSRPPRGCPPLPGSRRSIPRSAHRPGHGPPSGTGRPWASTRRRGATPRVPPRRASRAARRDRSPRRGWSRRAAIARRRARRDQVGRLAHGHRNRDTEVLGDDPQGNEDEPREEADDDDDRSPALDGHLVLEPAPGDVRGDAEREHDGEQAEHRDQPQRPRARREHELPEVADEARQAVPRRPPALPPELDGAVPGARDDPGQGDVQVDVGPAVGRDAAGDLAVDQAKAVESPELPIA